MKKFLIIYCMPAAAMAKMMQQSTPEDRQKSMAEWQSWMDANQASLADPGAPAGKNTRLTSDGANEVPNEIGGYSIMQGESKEAVIEVLRQSPHLTMPGSYTEIMELLEI